MGYDSWWYFKNIMGTDNHLTTFKVKKYFMRILIFRVATCQKMYNFRYGRDLWEYPLTISLSWWRNWSQEKLNNLLEISGPGSHGNRQRSLSYFPSALPWPRVPEGEETRITPCLQNCFFCIPKTSTWVLIYEFLKNHYFHTIHTYIHI